MKISPTNFFKKGYLWCQLEETQKSTDQRLGTHSKSLEVLRDKNKTLIHHIKRLKDENTDFKNRLSALEDKLYQLNIIASTDGLQIVSPCNKLK